jgi:putative intracellular protease/amidase
MTPPVREFQRNGTHRLIPSRYSEQGTVLAAVCDDAAMLADAALLDGATNDRIQGELRGLAGISPYELVYGIPNAHIVNAAFTHAHASGSRFNDSTRGAWYAAFEQKTSLAEVVYHKVRRLAAIIVPELPGQRPDREVSTCDDWLADFHAGFHALDPPSGYADCLQPEPVPACYAVSQQLAHTLLQQGSHGILYPSVRRSGGHCLVCFRPALVHNPRRGDRVSIELTAAGNSYRHTVTLIAK